MCKTSENKNNLQLLGGQVRYVICLFTRSRVRERVMRFALSRDGCVAFSPPQRHLTCGSMRCDAEKGGAYDFMGLQ